MKYGQNFRFGFFDIHPSDRVKAIKESGFSSLMQWWGDDFKKTDGDKIDITKYAKEYGLEYSALHAPSKNSSYIWKDCEIGEQKINEYMKVLEACGNIECPVMVMHLTHKLEFYEKNEIGVDRIQKLVDRGSELGVCVAIENTRRLDYNKYLFDAIDSKFLGACYDSGHNNCYTPNEDALTMFQNKIVVTHLHDNYGRSDDGREDDQHNLMGDGTVDWISIRKKILKVPLETISLESYCRPHSKFYGLSMQDFLNISFEKITSLIEKGTLI